MGRHGAHAIGALAVVQPRGAARRGPGRGCNVARGREASEERLAGGWRVCVSCRNRVARGRSYAARVSESVALDRPALVVVVGLGLVLAPALILAAIVELAHGFAFAAMTTFEWFAVAICTLVSIALVRAVLRELVGVIGLRLDDEGIARAGTRLSWAAIREVGSPRYGTLELRDASGRVLRISTYLLRDREALLREVGRRVGVSLRERTLSL